MTGRYAIRYRGTRRGRPVQGLLFGPGRAEVRARLRVAGISRVRVSIDAAATLSSWVRPGFDPLELEGFYNYLGRAIERGYARVPALSDAAEIVQDLRLRSAICVVRDLVQEGAALGRAMSAAGFPERDHRMMGAGEESGQLAATLEALAREVRREADLQRGLRRLLLSPSIVAFAAYVLAYCALVLLSPALGRVFADNERVLHLPGYARDYYEFVRGFNEHLGISSALYLGAGLATLAFVRSAACHALMERLVPGLARIAELGEMSQMWGAFSVMTRSGLGHASIARLLAAAARRTETRRRFRHFEQQCLLGVATDRAVERAGFPRYVVSGVRAACGAGALAEGTGDLAGRLALQVAILTQRAQVLVGAASAFLGALVVLGFAAITILPQMTTLLGSF